jgi:hypothetical protein
MSFFFVYIYEQRRSWYAIFNTDSLNILSTAMLTFILLPDGRFLALSGQRSDSLLHGSRNLPVIVRYSTQQF